MNHPTKYSKTNVANTPALYFFIFLVLYLFRVREHACEQGESNRESQADSPWNVEPDPGIPGSQDDDLS